MSRDYEFIVNIPVDDVTDVTVDVKELMDGLTDGAFDRYCRERNGGNYAAKKMVEAYFHGDLDLHKFFKSLGKEMVLKILEEC